jgi:hypothetical protein
MRVRAVLVAGAVLATAAVLGPMRAAEAATSVTFAPRTVLGPGVPRDPNVKPQQNVVPVGTVSLKMAAGQTAYVVSVMRANSATVRTLLDNEIVCKLPGGGSKNMVIGQNVYAKGGSAPAWEDVTLTTRYLVQADKAGTVVCTANVRTASLGYDNSTLRLVGGSLRFAAQSVANTTAGRPAQGSAPQGLTKVDSGTRTARVPATGTFDLASGFKKLSVFGDNEYMVCHTAKTCNTRGASTARFTLYVNQWKANGTVCHTDASTTTTRTVPYAVHHYFVALNKADFAVRTGNGCIPRFNAYVKVDWLAGQTGAVQGTAVGLTDSRGSVAKHNSDMSHVYAVPAR